jgi:hypothetical protein
MPTFGQEFFKGFTTVDSLRDYRHANKTFTANSFELKPRYKFLFHVSFTLNTQEIPTLKAAMGSDSVKNISLVVKTIDLPKYTIATETLNQYNRKRVIQTKINYDPVSITFHDDSGDLVRTMWYNYYAYYYKDPSQSYLAPNSQNGSMGPSANKQTGFGYNARDLYDDKRQVSDWGYIGEAFNDGNTSLLASSGKPPFFRDIRIYGMDQHKYAEYVLINPLISSFAHDQYDYSQGSGTMTNTMQLSYETVKYYTGAIGSQRPDINVQGFADPAHYDTTLSPISRPGSNSTIMGQGGLLDAGAGILQDLQSGGPLGAIGAVQKAGTVFNTFKGKNIKSIAASEATRLGTDVVKGSIPGAVKSMQGRPNGMFFPTPNGPTTNP